jgi:hypothetical protein
LAKCVDQLLAGDKEIRININVQPLSCGSNPQTQAARRAIHRKLQNEIHDTKGVLADLETLLKPTHRLRQGWFLSGQEGGHEQSRRAAEALVCIKTSRIFVNFSTRKIDRQSRETIQALLSAANRDLAFLEVADEGVGRSVPSSVSQFEPNPAIAATFRRDAKASIDDLRGWIDLAVRCRVAQMLRMYFV